MFQSKLLLCLCCSLLACTIHAQIQIGHKSISMNEDGLLRKTPPQNVKRGNFNKGSKFQVNIHRSESQKPEVEKFLEKRNEFMKLLNGSSLEQLALEEKLSRIYSFYKIYNTGHSECPGIKKLNCLFSMDKELLSRVNDSVNKHQHGVEIQDCMCKDDSGRICNAAGQLADSASVVLGQIEDLKQRRSLWRDLLCDFQNADTISLYKQVLSEKISFYPGFTLQTNRSKDELPSEIKFDPVYSIGEQKAELLGKGQKAYYRIKTHMKKGGIAVKSTDPFGTLTLKWADRTRNLLSPDWITAAKQGIESIKQQVAGIQTHPIIACNDSCESGELSQAINLLKTLDTLWCPSSPIGKYLRSWVWYSNGRFSLDYIKFPDPGMIKSGLTENATHQKDIDEQLKKITELKSCTSCRPRSFKTLVELQQLEKPLLKEKARLVRESDYLGKLQNNLAGLTTNSRIIHFLSLPFKIKNRRQYIYYHNGDNDFDTRSHRELFPDDMDIYFGIYNVHSPAQVTIEETRGIFNDSSAIEKDLSPALALLINNLSTLSPYGAGISRVIGSFKDVKDESNESSFDFSGFSKEDSTRIADSLSRIAAKAAAYKANCDNLKSEFKKRMWRMELLSQLLDGFKGPVPDLKTVQDKDTSYFTFSRKARITGAPFTDTFSVSYKKVVKSEGYFGVGRQKTITIGAGLFYDNHTIRQVNVDTAGANFNINKTDQKLRYVIGLKVFPWKNFDADNAIIPRYPLKRINIFGGFEITDPLANLYLGLGYDLIPGLQVSFGIHFAERNYYKIQNNQISDKTTAYKTSGPYYGVTLDPIVLASALKIIFNK
jgi:hypothetical protein